MALPPKHILACTDFSEPSRAAARRAALLAAEHAARLSLLTVLPVSALQDAVRLLADRYLPASEDRFDPKRVEQDLRERLAAEAARVGTGAGVPCEPVLRLGRAATEIAAAARETGADLVVLGRTGAHGLASDLLGTTAQRLLRTSPCPVLVVKQPPDFAYRTVLLPTDLSDESVRAISGALPLVPDAAFHVAHAFELPYEGLMNYANVGADAFAHYVRAEEQRLLVELDAFVERVGFGHRRPALHLEHGYPSTQVDAWIANLKPDLVALASRGKGELERLFLGSVSLHVVLTSPRDVLMMRQDETA